MIDSLLCALVSALSWVFCRLPPSVCVAVGTGVGQFASVLQPKRARIGYLNLKAAYGDRLSPPEAKRLVRRVFGQMGAGIVEMLRLPAIDAAYVDRYITIVGRSHIDDAVASGRPVMFLTGHFGNWELTSVIAAFIGVPIVALARAQRHFPKLYHLLISFRESKGCRVVHKGDAVRQLLRALRRRELVGVVGDQASRQGIPVEFFGRPAFFATGPFELARLSGAVILPAFLHRVRGPFHRLVIGPPFDLSTVPVAAPQPAGVSSAQSHKEAVVRFGIEWFARLLTRHIEEDPSQWLWLHKRWKHTPARRVLVLSDGKLGHVKQSLTVCQALKDESAQLTAQTVEVRYRTRLSRGLALAWAWLVPAGIGRLWCLRVTLEPACFQRLACTYADLIISCGSSTAPVNLLLAAENRAKSVVLMNPRPLPLRRFTLAFVPAHDGVAKRPNVVSTLGALSVATSEELRTAAEHLRTHPRFRSQAMGSGRRPVIAVLLGGDTPEYVLTQDFADSLMRQVLGACEALESSCLLTTSRRTPPSLEPWLAASVGAHPRCALLLLASRDQLNGTLAGMIGLARVVVVTGESVSMVSEACASGRRVVVVEPPVKSSRLTRTKSRRFLDQLVTQGYVDRRPVSEVGEAIHRALRESGTAPRLDSYASVREAVKRLL
ncbi:MAG: mitochondrial fission ELM1 family protein [Candidatus Omnitrophica bacterium]|nr:mitochondrial fission ELM1 family protein [Candidatus Omnitrophota bacterium]